MIKLSINAGFVAADQLLVKLADISVKSIIVVVLAFFICFLIKRASASLRNFVWLLAVIALAGLTILAPVYSPSPDQHRLLLADVRAAVSHASLPLSGSSRLTPVIAPAQKDTIPAVSAVPTYLRLMKQPVVTTSLPNTVVRAVILLWLVGSLLCGLHFASSMLVLRAVCASAIFVANGREYDLMRKSRAAIGAGANVRLAFSSPRSPIAVPVTWGYLRPVIVLPASVIEWDDARLSAALLHELAHIRRRDWLHQLLGLAVCCAYWFNPLVWFAVNKLREECEAASDDMVVESGVKPAEYAQRLLEIAQAAGKTGRSPRYAIAAMENCKLEKRLRAVLAAQNTHGAPSPIIRVAAALAAASFAAGIAQYSFCSAAGNIPLGSTLAVNSGQRPGDDSGESGYSVSDGNDAVAAPSPNAPVTLPNKVVVKLVGVSNSQTSQVSTLKFHGLSSGEKGRSFKFELNYPVADLTQPHDAEFAKNHSHDSVWNFKKAVLDYNAWYSDFYKNWQTYVPSIIYQYVPNDHLNEQYPTIQSVNVGARSVAENLEYSEAFKADRRIARVRIAVAAGPYVDIVDLPNLPSSKNGVAEPKVSLKSTFSTTASKAAGNSQVEITDNLAQKHTAHAFTDFDRRVRCLDSAGRSLGVFNLQFKSMGNDLAFTDTATIPNSILKQTDTLEFIARPYYWVEFDNVNLDQVEK